MNMRKKWVVYVGMFETGAYIISVVQCSYIQYSVMVTAIVMCTNYWPVSHLVMMV